MPPSFLCKTCHKSFLSRRGLLQHRNRSSCAKIIENSHPGLRALNEEEDRLYALRDKQPSTQNETQEEVEDDFSGYVDFDPQDEPHHNDNDAPILKKNGSVLRNNPVEYERLLIADCSPGQDNHESDINHQPSSRVAAGGNDHDQAISPPQGMVLVQQCHDSPAATREEEATPAVEANLEHEALLGKASLVSMSKYGKIQSAISYCDESMACFYKLCDDTGAPKFLCDRFFTLLSEQMLYNSFNPLNSEITKRKSYFERVQSRLGIPPPESIPVQLETGKEVVVYRYNFLERLQRHLISDVYSDLTNLSLPNVIDPWSSLFPRCREEEGDNPLDYSSTTR